MTTAAAIDRLIGIRNDAARKRGDSPTTTTTSSGIGDLFVWVHRQMSMLVRIFCNRCVSPLHRGGLGSSGNGAEWPG
jgi:hypothetical protein